VEEEEMRQRSPGTASQENCMMRGQEEEEEEGGGVGEGCGSPKAA